MVRKVSAAQAKAQLSALVAEVAYGKQRVIIERRGKPLAALVSIGDLDHLEKCQVTPTPRHWALELVGAWGDIMSNREIDEMVEHIYAEREKDFGRPVNLDEP